MTSLVFPGQGSQFVGMSKDFYDNFKIAKTTFEEIADYVNIDLKKLIFEDKDNLLNFTNYTQISIFTASLSIFKTLINETGINIKDIRFMLGHSLGEYTALACSQKLSLKECSLILKKRGQLMNDAVLPDKTSMAALIGSNFQKIQKIILENKMNIEVANDNSPIQVVISGSSDEIDNSKEVFLNNNIKKFIKLNVSAAFHSRFMSNAENLLISDIENLNFIFNEIKIISNYNAEASNNNEEISNALKNQMANMVKWTQSIETLEKLGETKIIEIGPNKILSGLIKRISDKFAIKNVSNISDLGDFND